MLRTVTKLVSDKNHFLVSTTYRLLYTEPLHKYVRTAHAAESFRSSFYESLHSDINISVTDLEELIKLERVRPSALLDGYKCVGKSLGLLSRVMPTAVKDLVTEAVDDATIRQFNNSIRSMQTEEQENVDIKESLKYHRDIHSEKHESEQEKLPYGVGIKTAVTEGLHHLLRVSTKV